MQVELCARCPYSPRDLADHCDSDAALHLEVTCDVEGPFKTSRRQTCRTRTIYATAKPAQIEFRAAPFATQSSASFAIIAAAPPSAQ